MQVLLNRYELRLVCWSPSHRACIIGMLRLEVLGSAEFRHDGYTGDSEEEEKMFLFPLLSHQFCK
jgi:hypothetical protein